MKVLIIEDEAPAFRRLQTILHEVDSDIEIIDVIATVDESVAWFNANKSPDLVFMDIQLSDGISFDIFDKVHIKAPVIFTTAFDEYTLKAFKVNSIDYLLKPIKKEEMLKSLQKLKHMEAVFNQTNQDSIQELLHQIKHSGSRYKSRFLIKTGETLISIDTADIAFFHTKNGLVYAIAHSGRKYLMDFTLDEITNQIDPNLFYRVNRQFIIQIQAIHKVHKYYRGKLLIEPKTEYDDQMIVSTEKASNFKQWLGAK